MLSSLDIRQNLQTGLIMRLYSTFGGEEHQRAGKKVSKITYEGYDGFVKKYGAPNSEDPVSMAIDKVLYFFEEVGVLLHKKLIDINLIETSSNNSYHYSAWQSYLDGSVKWCGVQKWNLYGTYRGHHDLLPDEGGILEAKSVSVLEEDKGRFRLRFHRAAVAQRQSCRICHNPMEFDYSMKKWNCLVCERSLNRVPRVQFSDEEKRYWGVGGKWD